MKLSVIDMARSTCGVADVDRSLLSRAEAEDRVPSRPERDGGAWGAEVLSEVGSEDMLGGGTMAVALKVKTVRVLWIRCC